MKKYVLLLFVVSLYMLVAVVLRHYYVPQLSLKIFFAGELLCLLNILLYAWNVKNLLGEQVSGLALFLPIKVLFVLAVFSYIQQVYGYNAVLSFLGGYFLFLPLFLLLSVPRRDENHLK